MVSDQNKREWLENWEKHFGGERTLNTPAEIATFVEGIVEMGKHVGSCSVRVNTRLTTNEQGVTQVVVDATPRA